jgi:hypothetical protein
MVGGKGKAFPVLFLFFSMLEQMQSIHKHSMYSMISMMTAMLLRHLATDVTSVPF